ncbi:hypothetical protein ACLX1H_007962 [Fusarium chlamydosporum]
MPRASSRVASKVHLCVAEGCGKTFTRKEHLRRHELNQSTNLTSVPVSAPQGPRHSPDRPDLAHASTPGKGSESSPVISGPSDDWQAEQRGHPQQVPGSWGSNISECADEMLAWQDWLMYEPANSSADSGTDFSWIFGGTQENTGYSELHDSESVIRPLPHNEYPITMAAHAAPDTPSIAEVAGPCFDLELPKCSFRVCRSLTREHRTELLEMLSSDLAYLEPSALSRASLLQGVHLFCRFVSKEVPIVHSYHLIPPAAYKDVLSNQFGLDSPPELMWAVITLGWTVLDRQKYREYHDIARKIQTILRRRIISNPLLQLEPPIWLVQALLLCLTFARYHGCREANGFATVFHGVLIQVVKRIDAYEPLRAEFVGEQTTDKLFTWFAWIRAQSKVRIPTSDDAWFCPSYDTWLPHSQLITVQAPDFLPALKSFWNSSIIKHTPSTFPRAVKWLMYGILAVAHDMKHRNDKSFSNKIAYTSEALGSRVSKSFQQWLQWWEETSQQPQMETVHLWRNCACMFRLGHTLFEVGASEWRILAGVDLIESKRVVASEYARTKRNIKAWSTSERSKVGVSSKDAAYLIQEQISPSYKAEVHCEHCWWCLYIAGLVCWGLGFVTHGSGTKLVQTIRQALEDCEDYLSKTAREDPQHKKDHSNETNGLLHVLLGLLRQSAHADEYLIEESVRSLSRIAGSTILT